MKKFSLIMATYGREKEVDSFLKTIRKSNYNLELVEIIIVDQNDKISLDEIVSKYTDLNIKHIKSEVKGLAKNRNIGLRESSGGIVAFPDDDCEYLPDTLKVINDIFEQDFSIDVVMGRIVERDGSDSLRKWPKEEMRITKQNFYTKCSSVTMFYRDGSNLRFNEKLGAGNYLGSCEDSDILYRALSSNKNVVYKPQVQIYHPHYSSDTNMNEGKVRSYGLGFGAFCKYNFDFHIFILFVKAEVFHILNTMIGIITFNKEKIKKGYIAFASRLKGLTIG